ncbi:PA0069 family radical SAM protein [Solitalea lacus]|uniref:PA0069 family radical SAM protein n=1 Tax=Solitalea lacus TaxID=2911172 RepID=UPI001EDB8337|nr:PA0069 family radical SAM protein [Solitalea lacus]UKJ05780.1 PA0069 family radical SAM protein [Solitalea lacus]
MDTMDYFKGRGAQINTQNPYLKQEYVTEHIEGLDEPLLENSATQLFKESAKKIVNKIESPDLPLMFSINPYQGCEHGCIYCYARNAHQYWGFSAGLDFERKIIVKHNAAELLIKNFEGKNWTPTPILLSGNTDCYQPIERKLKITRSLLKVFLKYKNPVSIITKNNLILRDMDLLTELNSFNLVHVNISITSLNEKLRQVLEPRTVTGEGRIQIIKQLTERNIPVRVMVAPIIPALNSEEIPSIIKKAAEAGASDAGYTIVRLNGSIGDLFTDWIYKNYPDRAEKVLNLIKECHGGQLNDSRYGTRMRGEGNVAESIRNLFKLSVAKYLANRQMREYSIHYFNNQHNKQLNLF